MEEEYFSADLISHQSGWQRLFDRISVRRNLSRIRRHKGGGRLLEVGIGNGSFLRAAREAGFHCVGVEASPALARHVEDTYGVQVFNAYLDDFVNTHSTSSFDVIVVNHVLEHMPDPRQAIRQLRSLLAPGGILHIAVPNTDSWEARLPGWTSYEPYHLFYFAPKTLTALLEDAGLEVLQLQTVEPFSGWFNSVTRTIMGSRYQEARTVADAAGRGGGQSVRRMLIESALNVGRIACGFITAPARFAQSRMAKGEELVAVVTTR